MSDNITVGSGETGAGDDLNIYPVDGVYYYADDAAVYLAARTTGISSLDAFTITEFSEDDGAVTVTIGPGLGWIKSGTFEGRSFCAKEKQTFILEDSGTYTIGLKYTRDGGEASTGGVAFFVDSTGVELENETENTTVEGVDGDGDLEAGEIGQWSTYYLPIYKIVVPEDCSGVHDIDSEDDPGDNEAYISNDYRGSSTCPLMADPITVVPSNDATFLEVEEQVVIGTGSTGSGEGDSVCIGASSTAGSMSVCIGTSSYAYINGVAIGSNCSANGGGTVAIGGARANGTYGIAMGKSADVNGNYGVAIGKGATTNTSLSGVAVTTGYEVVIGSEANSYGQYAVALGYGAAAGEKQFAISSEIETVNFNEADITAGNVNLSGYVYTGSDRRDKCDITDLKGGALAAVDELSPVQFRYNRRRDYVDMDALTDDQKNQLSKYGLTDYDKHAHAKLEKAEGKYHIGFLAQDTLATLEKYYGEDYSQIVANTMDGVDDAPDNVEDIYRVNYPELIPLLVKAIQELSAEVRDLKEKLDMAEDDAGEES